MKLRLCTLSLLVVTSFTLLRAADPPMLPDPWKHQDIGSAQVGKKVPVPPVEIFGKNALFGKSAELAGTAKHADAVFTLQGTMDVWGPMDGGHFVWQPMQGDFVFIGRVTSMENPGNNKHAKAGLCIRESLEGGARNVTQCITPVDGSQFTYRETMDGITVRIRPDTDNPKPSVPKEKFPCWLKLVRQGNEFTGYESLNGEMWWLTGTIKLDLKTDAMIGISSSSHTPDTLTTSLFDSLSVIQTSK